MHDSLSERTWGSASSLEAEISVISRIHANDWLNQLRKPHKSDIIKYGNLPKMTSGGETHGK